TLGQYNLLIDRHMSTLLYEVITFIYPFCPILIHFMNQPQQITVYDTAQTRFSPSPRLGLPGRPTCS
ncbi:hypothetical protein, partial [Peribacillus simplex]|uniref:hypothetical protein n=1 Tax=Peribacillus simplex TaxID=1478 RepID=UPI001C877169